MSKPKPKAARVFLCCDPGEWEYKEVKAKLAKLPFERIDLVVSTLTGGLHFADKYATDTLGRYFIEHLGTDDGASLKSGLPEIPRGVIDCDALVAFLSSTGPDLPGVKIALAAARESKMKVKVYRKE